MLDLRRPLSGCPVRVQDSTLPSPLSCVELPYLHRWLRRRRSTKEAHHTRLVIRGIEAALKAAGLPLPSIDDDEESEEEEEDGGGLGGGSGIYVSVKEAHFCAACQVDGHLQICRQVVEKVVSMNYPADVQSSVSGLNHRQFRQLVCA
jgi:hypothetical protein